MVVEDVALGMKAAVVGAIDGDIGMDRMPMIETKKVAEGGIASDIGSDEKETILMTKSMDTVVDDITEAAADLAADVPNAMEDTVKEADAEVGLNKATRGAAKSEELMLIQSAILKVGGRGLAPVKRRRGRELR